MVGKNKCQLDDEQGICIEDCKQAIVFFVRAGKGRRLTYRVDTVLEHASDPGATFYGYCAL